MRHAAATAAALALMAGTAASQQPPSRPLPRGEYLATIMDCAGCHTTGALAGQPQPGRHLAGSDVGFGTPGGIYYPPNLTPDRETGLGSWSAADLTKALRTGQRPDGRILAPVMPWQSYSALSDADMTALVSYLRGLPPVRNATPPMVGPGQNPTAPYLTLAVPNRS